GDPPEFPISLFRPFTQEQILAAIPRGKSAPGPDGLSLTFIRAIPIKILEMLFNLIGYIGKMPKSLLQARTIFIPKKSVPSSPGDYRPITLAPLLVRIFHRMLASRTQAEVTHHIRQKGFIQADGIAENSVLLHCLLTDARRKRREM